MTALDSIVRLRAIAARLLERADPDAAWFSAALQEYEAGCRHGLGFDDALSLAPEGGRPWWMLEAADKRDQITLQIASDYFPGLSARTAARQIVRAVRLYEQAGWRRHRQFMTAPAEIADTVRGAYFRLLKIGAPLSVRTAQRALCHEVPDAVAHGGASNTHETSEATNGNTGATDDQTSERPGYRAA